MILVTGINGLIGSDLYDFFESLPFEIYYIVRKKVPFISYSHQIIWDLTSPPPNEIKNHFNFIIHMAANAHNTNSRDVAITNEIMTRNLVNNLKGKYDNFIFFSSIAVYGEMNKVFPVDVGQTTHPSSEYGISKLKCEQFLRSNVNNLAILRLCPMIQGDGIKDLRKRVYFPFTKVKINSPFNRSYSVSDLKSIKKLLKKLILEFTDRELIVNVSNDSVYSEKMILSMFPGKIKFKPPKCMLIPIFYLTKKMKFFSIIHNLHNSLHKLFKVNTYV